LLVAAARRPSRRGGRRQNHELGPPTVGAVGMVAAERTGVGRVGRVVGGSRDDDQLTAALCAGEQADRDGDDRHQDADAEHRRDDNGDPQTDLTTVVRVGVVERVDRRHRVRSRVTSDWIARRRRPPGT